MADKKNLNKILVYVAAGLALLSVVMFFLPAIRYGNDDPVTFSGLQTAFGYTKVNDGDFLTIKEPYFAFSFLNVLTLILVIAGLVFSVLAVLGKGSKLFTIIGAACLLVGGVFFFLTVSFAVPAAGENTGIKLINKEYCSLGIGAVLGGIFSILGAVAAGIPLVLKNN